MVEELWIVMLALSPWLLMGAGIAGLLHVLLPPGLVRRRLRGGGGVIQAVIFGVPLPLCSCAVIPAGIGLKRDGASDGAALAFMISTPQTGVDSILVSGSFLGWPFALFKVVSAAVTGMVGGWLASMGSKEGEHADAAAPTRAHPRTMRELVIHSVDVLRSIWRWLVFGVIASASISAYVPNEVFTDISAWGEAWAILAILGISIPLYVCATASVPIAAAFVAGGLPASAAMVFLMAGPATNVATIGAIFRTFGGRKLAIYLTTIVVGSVGFGVAFDSLLSASTVSMPHHEEHTSILSTVGAITLILLLAYFAYEDITRWFKSRGGAPTVGLTVSVHGMTCGGCASRLEQALKGTDGVASAIVNLDRSEATIEGTLTRSQVTEVVTRTGFTVPEPTAEAL